LRAFLAYLLLASMIGTAVEWGDRAEGDLRWGETLQMGEYTLEAADFTPDDVTPGMVMLKLYRGEELVATRALKSGDSFSLDDEVMVVAEEVRRRDYRLDESTEPRAKVALLVRAVPELLVRVVSDEETYEAGDRGKIEIEIENVGMADAEEVEVELTSDPSIVSSRYSRSILAPGEVWDEDPDTEEIDPIAERFTVPSTPGPEEVFLRVCARYLDSEGGAHESWGGTSFDLFGPLKVNKRTEDSIRFGERGYVHLTASNGGERSLEVDLSDSAGKSFAADAALSWKMTIPPGGTETESYTISAKRPGEGQILPPAEAVYTIDGKVYKVTSTSPVVDVIGPLVEVKKTVSSSKVETGGEVTVNLTAENVGNRRTKASVKETIPSWARLVFGETEFSRLLLPGETASLEYTISCPEAGSFEIPPTTVCYRDEEGTACTLESSRLRITVEDEEIEDSAASEIGEAAPLASEENGVEPNGDQGDGGGGEGGGDGSEGGRNPEDGSLLWTIPALILIIFLAFDRYL
jgi:hypothetical protein